MSTNISKSNRAGWSVREWCVDTSISRSAYYTLPGELAPDSVTFGRRRIIQESPEKWLQRVGKVRP